MKIPITDIVIAVTSLWFLHQGWRKGFLKTIIGPLSLILGSIIPFIYFQKTNNIFHSLVLGIVAPFIVYLMLTFISKMLQKATKWDEKNIATPSRIGGSLANLFWQESLIILSIVAIGLVPLQFPGLNKVYNDIHRSVVYRIFDNWKENKLSSEDNSKIKNISSILETVSDPQNLERLKSSKEVLELVSDPQFSKLSSIILPKLSNSTNWEEIANDPEVQVILKDPEFKAKMDQLMQKSGSIASPPVTHP